MVETIDYIVERRNERFGRNGFATVLLQKPIKPLHEAERTQLLYFNETPAQTVGFARIGQTRFQSSKAFDRDANSISRRLSGSSRQPPNNETAEILQQFRDFVTSIQIQEQGRDGIQVKNSLMAHPLAQ